MYLEPIKDLIFLSSSQYGLPPYLQGLKGVRWRYAQTPEELKKLLMSQQGEIFVIIRSESLSERTVQAFMSWGKLKLKTSFIFIAQNIEKAAHQLTLANSQILLIYESEGLRIADIVTRRLLGLAVKSRKQERVPVQSQVMLKKSMVVDESPTGNTVQLLREGQMNDFSQGGAQIAVCEGGGVFVKDFVSLMYQNRHGRWVSVESQVRWVVSTNTGEQIIGVQFLAVSA